MRMMRGGSLLVVFLVGSAALPLGHHGSRGSSVSLVGEGQGQEPLGTDPVSAVPVRGPEQAQANSDALKMQLAAQENARREVEERARNAAEISKAAGRASTESIDRALAEMDRDKKPIDVMAEKYHTLGVTTKSTPESVRDAEEHAQRVSTMEKDMKIAAKKTNKMAEEHTKKNVPSLEGMQTAIKTTIDANMKEQLKDMPYAGDPDWSDVLPSEDGFYKPWKNNADLEPKKGASEEQSEMKAENEMLTQRQNAIANQEKHIEMEKDMLKGQMVKVMGAANHFQDKVLDEEDHEKAAAQKKVHDAAFAMNQAMRMAQHARVEEFETIKKQAAIKKDLVDAVKSRMSMEKAAQHELGQLKRDFSMKEHHDLHTLKRIAQTRIHAMASATQKIAKQLFEAKDQIKTDHSRIKYLKSKIVLMGRQYARQSEELASNIEKKESSFWNAQMTQEEKDALKRQNKLKGELSKANSEAAKVTKGALDSQKAMEAMKLPLEAKKIAAQLENDDKKTIQEMTDKTAKQKVKIDMLESSLENLRAKYEKQNAVLESKDKANKDLVALVGKVNVEKQEAQEAAESNAAQVQIEHQKVVDDKENLDVAPNGAIRDYDTLLTTACHGAGCQSLDDTAPALVLPTKSILFPEMTTPGRK